MFEAIVCSNGWDETTSSLQLIAHLDGEALNVALLVPEAQRRRPGVLLKTLSAHYASPGRLAKYKCQFERMTRPPGDDPAAFAIEHEPTGPRGFFQVTHQTSDENNGMSTESDKTSSGFEMLAQQLRERVQRPASENTETIDIENLMRLLLPMDSEIDKTEQLRSEAERVDDRASGNVA